jgi:two-component system response regulator YesN
MLLKILIVDDDIIMRMKLKTITGWEKYHYKIVDDASNGHEAMEKLKQYSVDIVITDIRMPNVNGIDLITLINEKHPHVKVIALSAFDDFEYVRQSMKNGAVDYILKHQLEEAYILKILGQTRKLIESEQKSKENLLHVKEQLEKGRLITTQEFIIDLVNGIFGDSEVILHNINRLELPIKMKNIVVIIVEIDNFLLYDDDKKRILTESVLSITNDILKDYDEAVGSKLNPESIIIIKSFENEYSELKINNQVNSIIQRIRNSIKLYLNITVSVGVGDLCNNVENINIYYRQALGVLNEKFYYGTNCVLRASEIKIKEKHERKIENGEKSKIVECLKEGTTEEIEGCISKLFGDLMSANYESVKSICLELVNIGIGIAQGYGVHIKKINYYKMIDKLDNIESLKVCIIQLFLKIKKLIVSSNILSNYSNYTKRTIEFINLNFQRDISLEDASSYVRLSKQYLCKVFKKDCGIGFTDFLNTKRIERAKELLYANELPLRDIIKKVGFNNYNYFIKVFKEKTGITPFEYKLLREKGDYRYIYVLLCQ